MLSALGGPGVWAAGTCYVGINDSDDIAQQLAFLLSLPYSEAIVEALAIWIQDARGKARLLWRSHGLLADDLVWHQLAPVRDGGPVCVEEARPSPGDKAKKLINDGQEFAAREFWLQEVWARKLVEELKASDAPVLDKLKLGLDPERRTVPEAT